MKQVAAIIPVYNEADKIKDTIEGITEIKEVKSIYVVDDGSTDNTAKIVQNLNVNLIRLNRNYGKGYAIKKAIKNLSYDYIVLLDGDLGKTSKEASKLIYPLLNDEADVAVAKFPKAKRKGGFGFVKKLALFGVYYYTGNKFYSTLSGQRAYKREVIENIKFIPDRYGIEVAMTVETLRLGYRMVEVDVDMTHRETGRDIRGFIHRGKQFLDIFKTLVLLYFKR